MTGGPGSVWGVLYDEQENCYEDYEIDEEGLHMERREDFTPVQARQLYEALKAYYEEVVAQ